MGVGCSKVSLIGVADRLTGFTPEQQPAPQPGDRQPDLNLPALATPRESAFVLSPAARAYQLANQARGGDGDAKSDASHYSDSPSPLSISPVHSESSEPAPRPAVVPPLRLPPSESAALAPAQPDTLPSPVAFTNKLPPQQKPLIDLATPAGWRQWQLRIAESRATAEQAARGRQKPKAQKPDITIPPYANGSGSLYSAGISSQADQTPAISAGNTEASKQPGTGNSNDLNNSWAKSGDPATTPWAARSTKSHGITMP